MNTKGIILSAALAAFGATSAHAGAVSSWKGAPSWRTQANWKSAAIWSAASSWNGVWSGLLNKSEPVSVTIAGGKVVGYTIRGMSPFEIQTASVVGNKVFMLIGANYRVSLTKLSAKAAYGTASGPLGAGTASLIRQ